LPNDGLITEIILDTYYSSLTYVIRNNVDMFNYKMHNIVENFCGCLWTKLNSVNSNLKNFFVYESKIFFIFFVI